jgi:two-component system CheB/CheR fusion protein
MRRSALRSSGQHWALAGGQLPALLSRATAMPVHAVEGEMAIEANHVYVITPGHVLEMQEGRLRAQPLTEGQVRPPAVDHFMMSLAADQRERAVGAVLTSTDGDGSIGIRAIKSEGFPFVERLSRTA